MKHVLFSLLILLGGVSMTYGQRTVSGKVTDSAGEPIIGASVTAKGAAGVGTITDIDGMYSLSVPSNVTELEVSYTGYDAYEVALGAASTYDVTMNEGKVLDEVVVTGLGIRKEKKALGYAVTTISSADIELKPEADVTRVLRGKVPGVNINQTSGLAGSGTNVIIRGYKSISGSNQPLFVVDGVPFGSATSADRGALAGNATTSSRFLDIDPNNVAEVSVLKGLSATVLYGEAGKNGVILITTKTSTHKNKNDKMSVFVEQGVFVNEIASLPEDQDFYGNGFDNAASGAFSNWGADVRQPGRQGNNLAADGTINHPYNRAAITGFYPEYIGARYAYKNYDNLEGFFKKGLTYNTSVGASARVDKTSVNFTYSRRDEDGFIPLSNLKRNNLSLGTSTVLSNGLTITSAFNYANLNKVAPPAATSTSSNPNDGSSLFSNIFYTPRSVDLNGLDYDLPDGSSIFYRGGNDIQHPYWTLNNTADRENVNRFFGNIGAKFDITDWFSLNYRLGLDTYTQNQRYEINRGGTQVADGLLVTSNRVNTIYDHNFNGQFAKDLSESINLDAVVGVNLRTDDLDRTFTSSTNQFVYGLFTHNNFITHDNGSDKFKEKLLGAYATATLAYKSFLYLNLQGRNDWTSTLEPGNNSIFYPSASLSFVPTDAFAGLTNNKVLDYLKLRIGYGTSAGYPDPYRTRSVLGTQAREFITSGGTVINTNSVADIFGNVNIKPELHKEIEFGVDARLFNNLIGLEASFYDKKSTDLLVDLDLDPSTGYGETTVNAAKVSNRGIELGLTVNAIDKKDLTLSFNGNFTTLENKVEELVEGVDQINILGLFTTLGSYAVPGQDFGVIQGQKVTRHENGGLLVGSNGLYILDNKLQILGSPLENYSVNGGFNLGFKGINLSALMTYQDGGTMYATGPSTLLGRGILQETDFDRFVPVIAPGVKADGTPNDVQTSSTAHYWQNGGVFIDEMRIYDASYWKLREVALSYRIPSSLLAKSPFGSAVVSLTGQNLAFKALGFPAGANFDPEVSATGVGNARGFEFMNTPTSKSYGGTIRFTF
jgi:TonB-linked SusC/RagA family outer membrane protein